MRRRRRWLGASEAGVVVDRGALLEVASQLQHRAGDASVRGLQRGLAGQPGGIPGEAELRQRPRRGVTSSMSTWLASTRSQVRPAVASALAKALCAAAAVSAWPCGATASGELARIPACTPAQCNGTDHSSGLPSESSSANASSRVCCSRSTCRIRAAATHNSPSGSSENRSIEYSASTSIAAYQCFCTAPLSPLRRAIAVCSAAAHSASRRCSADSCPRSRRRRRRPPRPAGRPASAPSPAAAGAGARRSRVLAGCPGPIAHGPADHAAGPHRVAAVQGGERHQRGGGVGCDACRLLFGGDRLAQPCDRRRVRLPRATAADPRRGCAPPVRSTSAGPRCRR